MSAAKLAVEGVSMRFPDRPGWALKDAGFEVREGEFLCLLGPSGCGKTTLLKLIAGLLQPTEGRIVTRPAGARRLFQCMVFQDLALFPWRTVEQNVALALELGGLPSSRGAGAVDEALRRLRLSEFKDHYPAQLSGGTKQRVALARAFVADPEVLLMDEPFASADAAMRRLLQEELLRLWKEQRRTVVFVTHDIDEALRLADRVILLTRGPARVKAVFDVPWPRPRDAKPERPALARRIWEQLEEEFAAAGECP